MGSLLYVWKPSGAVRADSRETLETLLSREAERHEAALGGNIEKHVHATRRVLIGQLAWDTGVLGWHAWREAGQKGCAWTGVCEDELAFGEAEDVVPSVLAAMQSRERLRALAGRFAVCAWDDSFGRTTIATGPTGTVSLWYTSGTAGWACGSRVAPLLRLVGRHAELDEQSAKLFLAYGYHIGSGSFFANVSRLRARRRVLLEDSSEPPRVERYASIADLLDESDGEQDLGSVAAQGAARLTDRVVWQLRRSSMPVVHLSGGRDSRLIAAAAAHSGYQSRIVTAGPDDSVDVQVAGEVAARLGLRHAAKTPGLRSELSLEEAKAWLRLTDGVTVIRHHSFPRFGTGKSATPRQIFHGLAGEMSRGYYYAGATGLDARERSNGRRVIANRAWTYLLSRATHVEDLIAEPVAALQAELGPLRPTLGQWLDAFYWQFRCLQWGVDTLSISDLLTWNWTPLLDRDLISISWPLSAAAKHSNQFVELMTSALAPQLSGVAYDKSAPALRPERNLARRAVGIVARTARSVPRRFRPVRLPVMRAVSPYSDEALRAFWRQLFLDKGPQQWRAIANAKRVERLVELNPSAEELWRLATIELFAQVDW